MRIRSKIEGFDEWLFIEELPDAYSPGSQLSEKHISIKRESVKKLFYYQLSSGGLFLLHSNMQFNDPIRILSEVEGETITSQFIFYEGGNMPVKIPRKGIYGNNRHNIRYIPSSKGKYEVIPGMEYRYFLMVLSKEYYFHLIDRHALIHSSFVAAIMEGKYTSLAAQDLAVTPEMKRVINDICECKKTGEIKKFYTESKVLELLMLQLEQMQNNNADDDGPQIKTEDLEKLYQAKELLDKVYVNPPTIKKLSRIISLNEFKLKQGFKAYYGTTVYGYITRLRMETAKKMIINDHKSIGEVAHAIGFKHQAHLTSAFKKYYGILPSEIKLTV
ncbi:helix-turn-helix transcriptional regulator [Mucilaginibacter sp. SMC90]|uniref:helix-turn-helix transcriptional regulator n=1 Tax=Mucilaginibacter sp. SMC90 TaxID=2929803 RepID=UPI001FB3FFF5|nr:helix-turn-helix transcriptional regulator [Mucilaginibacter sp. SMC90]UOE52330.1 helix-turn-helix transcriptional regulator [Mucilaginibacter sp. SMC90]